MIGPGSQRLNYNIYLDATRRTIWGNGAGITQVYIDTNPPNATPVIVPAFGRIFARQNVESGQYADSVHTVILF
jgi:spore coat protein U-like protein